MKKEIKIALTAVVALVLLFIGLNFLKGINVFQSTNTYYVKFKNVVGLSVSNPVYANGYPVGIVRSIAYDYQRGDNVVVGIELDDEMRVAQGTTAELETDLMGGVKMNLLMGPNPAKNLEQGDTLAGDIHKGMMDKVQTMVPAIEKMVPQLNSIMQNLNKLLADPALAQTLKNTAALTGELKQSAEQLNVMMKGDIPATLASLKKASANAEKLSANLAALDVQTTLNNVNKTIESAHNLSKQMGDMAENLDRKLKGTDSTLGLFLNDRGVYDNLNSTLRNADSLMIDLKAHPKRYVHFSVFGRKDK